MAQPTRRGKHTRPTPHRYALMASDPPAGPAPHSLGAVRCRAPGQQPSYARADYGEEERWPRQDPSRDGSRGRWPDEASLGWRLPPRLPLARGTLRFGDLFRRHLLREAVTVPDRPIPFLAWLLMCGREAEPHVGADVVLRRTPTVGVQRAELDLRFVGAL